MDAVGPWAIQTVRKSDTTSDGHEVHIEVVVHQVELLGRGKRTRSAVDFAGEFTVSGIEFVFPHHSELWEQIRNRFFLSSFVHENNKTFFRIQHLSQRWPVLAHHWGLRRNISHVRKASPVENRLPRVS